jgi:hypothetical protein
VLGGKPAGVDVYHDHPLGASARDVFGSSQH